MSLIVYRIIVIAFLLIILGSLASALIFLVKDKGQSERTVKALTVRISLSLILFLLLMAGFYFGILPPRH
ncbi:MAG: twin transmembrane helix small protein [Burkholderiales bacterium]